MIVKLNLDPVKDAAIIAHLEEQKQITGRTANALAKELLRSGIDVETSIAEAIKTYVSDGLGRIEATVRLAVIEALAPLLVSNSDLEVRNSDLEVQFSDPNSDNSPEVVNAFGDW